MKAQLHNRVYTETLECFMCNEPIICYSTITGLMLVRCTSRKKCNLSNLYNDQIFKL